MDTYPKITTLQNVLMQVNLPEWKYLPIITVEIATAAIPPPILRALYEDRSSRNMLVIKLTALSKNIGKLSLMIYGRNHEDL